MKRTLSLITLIAISLNLSPAANAKNYNLQNKTEFDLVKKNAEEGDAYFQAVLGQSLLYGLGIKQDKAKGLALINQSAELKNPLGLSSLCRAYYGEMADVEFKPKAADICRESFSELVKLADRGDAYAQSNLGYIYKNGLSVDKDLEEAVKWFQKAAQQDNVLAQNNLGVMYQYDTGTNKDLAEAVKWYRKAAEQDYAQAQNNLGYMYSFGTGVNKDLAEAVRWYQKSAKQGDTDAQTNLGVMHLNGTGVDKDLNKAAIYFYNAAIEDEPIAQYYLGYMYYYGVGKGVNYKAAQSWLSKSASHGDTDAQELLLKVDSTIEFLTLPPFVKEHILFGSDNYSKKEIDEIYLKNMMIKKKGDMVVAFRLSVFQSQSDEEINFEGWVYNLKTKKVFPVMTKEGGNGTAVIPAPITRLKINSLKEFEFKTKKPINFVSDPDDYTVCSDYKAIFTLDYFQHSPESPVVDHHYYGSRCKS